MSESFDYLETEQSVLELWGNEYRDLAELIHEPGIRFTSDRRVEVQLVESVRTDTGEETSTVYFQGPKARHLKYAGKAHPNPVAMQLALIEILCGLNSQSLEDLDLKSTMRLTRVADCFL